MKNPSKLDPSRTALLRRQCIAEFRRRINKFMKSLYNFIVREDALGLRPIEKLELNATREFAFLTNPAKLNSFKLWLKQQIEAELLSTIDWQGKPWMAKYVESAYKKGAMRAYVATHSESLAKSLAYYIGGKEQFLKQSFMQPEKLSKIQLIYTRAYNELEGFTKVMDTQISRILANGLANGKGPASIAREIAEKVSNMTKTRALTIARTEIIYAHAEGQLDTFTDLGIKEVNAEVEWSTAGDGIVCEECASMEGKVYKVSEAHGLIPLHPNCRCAWIPYV